MNIYSRVRVWYQKFQHIPLFKVVRNVKEIYNKWYWNERKVKKNWAKKENAPFFIIRRYAKNMGIGSYIISNLSQIKYAEERGYTPVIDMLNYNGTQIAGKGIVNSWELYFKQEKRALQEAYKSKNYILSNGECLKDSPNDSVEFLYNKEKMLHWQELFARYVDFNDELTAYTHKEYEELFGDKGKILGVLCRGTDYLKLKPKGHPVQPETNTIIKKVAQIMSEYRCDYIYLATEDYDIEKAFREVFGEKIIVNKRVYKNYTDGYLANTYNNRNNDLYLTNMEYLSSLNLLSKCDCFIGGRTSGTVITMLMNPEFEYMYFWDLGIYD